MKHKYVYGTAAEKIQYDVYEENNVLRQKKQQRSSNKVKVKMILNILFVFALGAIIALRYAMITEISYNIDKKTKEYNKIVNENSRLKVAIEENMNISKIKDIAEGKLGMQKPDKYQIVYVNVPRNDFSMVSEKYKDSDESKGAVAAVIDKLGKITELLY
ncbi:MAG: cell division protein FtsL [Clostridia bacterium]|nr:cell division protein FtsL [Clostridia bacterium]